MTATLSTATGKTHRVAELREVIGNYYVADGDRDHGRFGAKARTACGRTYEGLVSPDGSTVNCTKCGEAAEETPATEAPAPATYVAVRAGGRYRVENTVVGGYVATCSSKAKAEEKAAMLNEADVLAAANAVRLAEWNAELSAAEATEELPKPHAICGRTKGDEDTCLACDKKSMRDRAAAATEDAARERAAAETADTTKAPQLMSVWVGWRIADGLIPLADDLADPALASAAAKLRDRQPNKVLDRTVRLSFAECSALSAHATFVENEALAEGASLKDRGPLVYSARTLRGRLAAAWA